MSDLATLAQLKTALKITDNEQDDELQLILDATCNAIICYAGKFESTPVVGEIHDGMISDTIVPECNPLLSVEKVSFECVSGVVTILDTNQYYFDDCSIMLKCFFTPRGRGVILIDYTAGYTSVPPDVILAHIEASKITYQYSSSNQEHLQSVSKKDESYSSGAASGELFSEESGLPHSVEAKLKKYRNYGFPNAGMAQRNR